MYWEVKDKVIEEAFNGVRMERKPRKIKVYGLDSTREIRARLIEILYERVAYHKDKFVAPILHSEMRAMEVKKNGKVEHSDNSHDDQVFSYLMAMYVWYDGKNLAQNWHIQKNTLKTDAEEELEESYIEDQLEAKEKVDLQSVSYDVDNDVLEDLDWVEQASKSFITSDDILAEQYIRKLEQRNILASQNEDVRNTLLNNSGADTISYQNQTVTYVSLPPSMFSMDNDISLDDEDQYSINHKSNLAGNLAQFYDDV